MITFSIHVDLKQQTSTAVINAISEHFAPFSMKAFLMSSASFTSFDLNGM